jgi:hypothetical protein
LAEKLVTRNFGLGTLGFLKTNAEGEQQDRVIFAG